VATVTGEDVTSGYARAMDLAVVGIVAIWHVGYDLPKMQRGWATYRPAAVELAVWGALAVIGVVGSVLLLRGRRSRVAARTLAAAVVVLGAIGTAACPPGAAIGDMSWAWNAVGWFGVLLLIRRPLWELGVLLIANALVTGANLAPNLAMAARYLVVIAISVGVQLAVVLVGRLVHDAAQQASDAAAAQAQTRARRDAADRVHAGRRRRYAYLRTRLEPLLTGLADGDLDVGEASVRRQCALEAARLRRLFAENDDAANPLLHELRASADIAERRDVAIELIALGEPPDLPLDVRRALTEAPLAVITAATTRARATVFAGPDEVIVCVFADAPADTPVPHIDLPALRTTHDHEGEDLWVETRWTARSPSP
jgi:hypothetical protein